MVGISATSAFIEVGAETGQTSALLSLADWNGPGYVFEVLPAGAIRMTEQSDPAAPAANKSLLYTRDNGSGKTQIVARFPTGAVQVIATEP
jgi:hypothetical protein